MQNIRLLFGGDFGITNNSKFKHDIDGDLLDLFRNTQLNVLDLECPVTNGDTSNRIFKTGPNIYGLSEINGQILKTLNIHLLTLANNHILDYGIQGIKDTIDFCSKNGFATVGAGINFTNAQRPFRLEIDGCKISIINFAENEWCSASPKSAGANPMNVVENTKQIKAEKNYADYVVVVIHGGFEFYNLPSPRIVNQYRFYAENGADLILSNHTHCISGWEIYNSTPIFYGLGNFLLTIPSHYTDWYTGLVLEVNIGKEGLTTVLHPIKSSFDFSLSLLKDTEKDRIMERVLFYSKTLRDDILLNKEWENLIQFETKNYLKHWSPIGYIGNRYFQGIINRLNLYRLFVNRKRMALYLNLQRCESHSEVSQAVLTQFLR